LEKETLITNAAKSIYTYCRARTSTREEAEDLSQDILLELLKSQGNLRDDKAFYGFMWAVASNVYKNWCKKRACLRAQAALDENTPDTSAPLLEALENAADIVLLHRELSLLTAQYRKVVVAYYFNNKKVSEISKTENISESMVKFLLFKSRKIIKEGITMEKPRGTQSFNPAILKLGLAIGKSWRPYLDSTQMEKNLIAQNILTACYYEACTAEEISLQLGVAVPYLEYHLQELTENGVLQKTNIRYTTAITIFTKSFIEEADAKTKTLQTQIADLLTTFLDTHHEQIKTVGKHTGTTDPGLLRWQIAQLIIEQATLEKRNDRLPQKNHGGHSLFVWGEEYPDRYGCMFAYYKNKHGDQVKCLEFFCNSFNERIFDFGYFWNRDDRVRLFLETAKYKHSGFPPDEKIEIAEFIKHGYLKKDGEKLTPNVPIYTARQYEQTLDLLTDVITDVSKKTDEIIKVATEILLQHTPANKKKEAAEIAFLIKHHLAMRNPIEIMLGSGSLRAFTTNEHPTTYITLK